MINVIITGCCGKMGKVLSRLIAQDEEMKIIAGIDRNANQPDSNHPFEVFTELSECSHKADVVIDFSHYSALPKILDYCISTNTPLVTATTGLSEEDHARILEASKTVPIFQSANMSLGVNVMLDLAKAAAKALYEKFDIEIIEKHHNKKVDSPSGTAYMIANAINDALSEQLDYVYGRHGKSDERKKTDVGIHAIRGGNIVGEHTVIFAGQDEIIEIKHTAVSKDIFALGAIKAAKFLVDKTPGYYNMNSMLK
ncbi:MAG: 4-hydroxy-tetrahydrodipicolinate reductase [Bacillota bacterium]